MTCAAVFALVGGVLVERGSDTVAMAPHPEGGAVICWHNSAATMTRSGGWSLALPDLTVAGTLTANSSGPDRIEIIPAPGWFVWPPDDAIQEVPDGAEVTTFLAHAATIPPQPEPIIAPILDPTLVVIDGKLRDAPSLRRIPIPGDPDGRPGHEVAYWWSDEPYGEGEKWQSLSRTSQARIFPTTRRTTTSSGSIGIRSAPFDTFGATAWQSAFAAPRRLSTPPGKETGPRQRTDPVAPIPLPASLWMLLAGGATIRAARICQTLRFTGRAAIAVILASGLAIGGAGPLRSTDRRSPWASTK